MKLRKMYCSIIAGCLLGLTAGISLASAAPLGERILKTGSIGEDVRQVQMYLSQQGLNPGPVDAIFGQSTQAAVAAFQKGEGLKADGIMGRETIQAVRNGGAAEASRSKSARSQPELNIVATAYAPGHEDNGRWGNLTHIGTQVRPGIIAVDPKVIPLGSRVYIEFPDGHGMYALAEDTGGAIKGNRIDIAFWTRAEAKQFGIQDVKVYITG
jgi:3D (Asp-Asp-Asp) domain-containing protein